MSNDPSIGVRRRHLPSAGSAKGRKGILSIKPLLDRDRQIGAVDQHDRPRRSRWPLRGAASRRRRGGETGRCARSDEARGWRTAEGRAGKKRPRRRLHWWRRSVLGHYRVGRSALLEHHHDAIATAAGREHVDRIGTGAHAEKDTDRIHASRLEQIGRIGADACPQATPFGHGVRHDLLRLADDCCRAAPLANLDGLRRGPSRATNKRGDGEQERLQLGQHAGSSF